MEGAKHRGGGDAGIQLLLTVCFALSGLYWFPSLSPLNENNSFMPGQDPPVNNSAKYLQQISSKMLFIDCFVIRCAHTNTHTYIRRRNTQTLNRALSSRGTSLFGVHNCLCVCVCKGLVQKGLGQWSLSLGDVDFYLPLLPSLPLLFLSQSPFTSGSPHQLTRNKGADGGRKKAWIGGGGKEKVRNWRKGSVFEPKFPPCRKSKLHNVIVIVWCMGGSANTACA